MEARYSITDDRFDISDLENKKLIMEFQMDKLVFIVYNCKHNYIEWLEDFSISNWSTDLATIFEEHHFLKANFWQEIGLVYHAEYKAIVPRQFIGKINKSILIPNFEKKEDETAIKIFKLSEEKSLLYHVPILISDFLSKIYIDKTITFLPKEVCLPNVRNGLVLQFCDRWVSFCAFDNGQLSNSKTIKMIDANQFDELFDFFYENKKEVILIGTITNYSPFYNLIKQKEGEMKFGELSSGVKFSQYFTEVPKHKYFTIFNSINFF